MTESEQNTLKTKPASGEGNSPSQTRRKFVKTMAAGAGLAFGMPASSYARILGANDRIGFGIIGVGRMGRGHLNTLVNMVPDQAQVLALSDVYRANLDWASLRAPGADTYGDFRELLTRPDIDAVVVASPDHWHALQTVMACQSGKDVYVEKPSCLAIKEGRKMVDAARANDRVVQVGTQQRSQWHFQKAVEIVRSGRLGPISFVRSWNYGNEYPDGIGNPADSSPPPGLDWDMWLGPAPALPFNINRFGVILDDDGNYTRWASFRWFWNYAGGMMTDWGVHLLDIVQWAMEEDYPLSASATGGKFYLTDNRETPDTVSATFRYPGFVSTYENRTCNSKQMDGHGYGIMFHGTKGTLFVDRGGYELIPESGSDLQPTRVEAQGGAPHMQNFIDCIRSRARPVSDIEIGHRSSSVAILGNVAFRSGRHIKWDGETEEIIGDDEAAKLLHVTYRSPWTI